MNAQEASVEYAETLKYLNNTLIKEISAVTEELEAGGNNNKLLDPVFRKTLAKMYKEAFDSIEEIKKIQCTWQGHTLGSGGYLSK